MTRSIVAAKQLRKQIGEDVQGATKTLKRRDGIESLCSVICEGGAAFRKRHNVGNGNVVLVETGVLVREREKEYEDLDQRMLDVIYPETFSWCENDYERNGVKDVRISTSSRYDATILRRIVLMDSRYSVLLVQSTTRTSNSRALDS